MRKIALTLAALAMTASAADAGPLRDRLKARFGRPSCSSCQQPATVAFPAAPAVASGTVTYTVGSACANGVCPAPTVIRR